MRGLIVVALLLAGPALGQPASEQARREMMDAGELAGSVVACAASPQTVFRMWRADEASLGFGREAEFSLHYLAGLMVGMQRQLPPRDCVNLLRAMRLLHGE